MENAIYFLGVNIIGFIIFGIDKLHAIQKRNRIPEKVLFIISVMGGCIGIGIGMILFRHKIRKLKFIIGIPILIGIWIILWTIGGML